MQDIDKCLLEAIAQGNRIDEMVRQLSGMLESRVLAADRVTHHLQGEIVFQQGQNQTQDINFNVPDGNDFDAIRMMLLPEVRFITLDETTDGPSDLTYRPTTWMSAGLGIDSGCSVDALVALNYTGPSGDRPYQNVGWFAAQAFSSPINLNQLVNKGSTSFFASAERYGRNEYGSGLVFEPYWPLEAGSSLVCQVTPLFSAARPADADGRVFEYRIRGILEGQKRVHR